MNERALPCNMNPNEFAAGECPDAGSRNCPRALPGAECLVDLQYVREVTEAKCRYFKRKAAKR